MNVTDSRMVPQNQAVHQALMEAFPPIIVLTQDLLQPLSLVFKQV